MSARCQWLARCTNQATKVCQTAVGPFLACDTCVPPLKPARPAPVADTYDPYAEDWDWDTNREGDPAFNGAFNRW